MADDKNAQLQSLIERITDAWVGDIVWEDPADIQRMHERAKCVLLEIGKTHMLVSRELFKPEVTPGPTAETKRAERVA